LLVGVVIFFAVKVGRYASCVRVWSLCWMFGEVGHLVSIIEVGYSIMHVFVFLC